MIATILNNLTNGENLDQATSAQIMTQIMDGELTPSQISALLVALKMKGETIDEIAGFVTAMRAKALQITAPAGAVDTCGTGGDGTHTFNISTAAAIVTAAAGVPVAKHGNRSISSKSGSADILQELGVKIDLKPEQAESCLQKVNFSFLFAPIFHGSMKHAALPRKEIGIRSIFNILGPMSNPANAKRQLIGAFDTEAADKMIRVLQKTGSEHVLVVHSIDGLDEISISAPTLIIELKEGQLSKFQIEPKNFGITNQPSSSIKGGTPSENAEIMLSVLAGKESAYAQVTALNAGAALYVAGKCDSIKRGVELAQTLLSEGAGERKLQEIVGYTQLYA